MLHIWYYFPWVSFADRSLWKNPRRILQLLFIFRPNLSDWLMALEVLLYNLLVLNSSLRCMLHKHKSSIQNKNHSINGVGGQFLGNITYESLRGAFCFLSVSVSTSVVLWWQTKVMKIGKVRLRLIFEIQVSNHHKKCLVSVDVAYPTSSWVVVKNSDLSDSQLTSTIVIDVWNDGDINMQTDATTRHQLLQKFRQRWAKTGLTYGQ